MALERLKVGGNEVEGHGRVERGRAFACDDAGEEIAEGVFEDAVVAGAALHLKQPSPSLRCLGSWSRQIERKQEAAVGQGWALQVWRRSLAQNSN
jgi:hypothetical protein